LHVFIYLDVRRAPSSESYLSTNANQISYYRLLWVEWNINNKMYKWATSWQNQHSGVATSMDPDQPAHPRSLVRIHAFRLLTLLQVEKLTAYKWILIRLRGCAGWSGSMLVANPICWFCRDAAQINFTNCRLQDLDILANDNLLLRLKYDGTVDWEPPLLFVTHCEVCPT
jgi:hypothetical protein